MAFATALAACRNVAMFPFTKYNQLLDKHPWKTKCVTSAFMYGAGDLCAQKAEHYNKSKEAEEKGEDAPGFHIDWSRAGVFFTFGLLVGGPAYTAWFARLDMLPAQLWALRNARQRAEIMRAYNLLKRHGIDVNLRMDRLVRHRLMPFSGPGLRENDDLDTFCDSQAPAARPACARTTAL